MPLIGRFPTRRFELAFCVALLLGCTGLIGLVREQRDLSGVLVLLTLELILPLSMGLVAAGLLAGDPALELMLTMHRPVGRVLAERLGLLFGVAAGFGAGLLALAQRWAIPLPKDGSDPIFIWLSPLVFTLGLANAASLLRGHLLDGAIAAAAVMGLSLLALLQIPQLCASVPEGELCPAWLASPVMSLAGAADPAWPLNRLVWLGLGIGLLALSFVLARREEPLLPQGSLE